MQMEYSMPAYNTDNSIKIILIGFLLVFIASLGGNFYLILKLQEVLNRPPTVVTVNSAEETLPSFDWVNQYLEVKSGEPIAWKQCPDDESQCAFWENYQRDEPLPTVEIKECMQQGTRIVDGQLVTGLPAGEHTIVGATIRPCTESSGIN